MIYDFDPYNRPESIIQVKNELKILSEQIKIVEGLEHSRARLAATNPLNSQTLSKCNVFMQYVNDIVPGSNFDLELRKLNFNELAFCSISFEERRLKSVIPYFKATNIRTYMERARVSCLERPELLTRLKRLSAKSDGKPFQDIYTATFEAHCNPRDYIKTNEQVDHDPEPDTMARQPGAFVFPAARWKNIEKVFPVQAVGAIRHAPQRITDPEITDCVRSRYPRGRGDGDAIIWLDLGSVGALPPLDDSGPGVKTTQICTVFGDTISKAIEESDMRQWEKRHGRMDTTECVKLKVCCHAELRIAYDTTIAKALFN